jgi:hypothetical protein
MTKTPVLGRLKRVSLRNIWQHEAHSFTSLLSQSENLELLSSVYEADA